MTWSNIWIFRRNESISPKSSINFLQPLSPSKCFFFQVLTSHARTDYAAVISRFVKDQPQSHLGNVVIFDLPIYQVVESIKSSIRKTFVQTKLSFFLSCKLITPVHLKLTVGTSWPLSWGETVFKVRNRELFLNLISKLVFVQECYLKDAYFSIVSGPTQYKCLSNEEKTV